MGSSICAASCSGRVSASRCRFAASAALVAASDAEASVSSAGRNSGHLEMQHRRPVLNQGHQALIIRFSSRTAKMALYRDGWMAFEVCRGMYKGGDTDCGLGACASRHSGLVIV